MAQIPFDIVGFDLDGTLLDTSRDLGNALNHALGLAGRPPVPLDEVTRHIGGGAAQMLRSALSESGGVDESAFAGLQASLLEFYAANIADHTALFPGGAEMLDALNAAGAKIAIATNKREDMALRLFDALGMTHRFATVIGGDTLGPGRAKPKPDMLHEMVSRCGGGRAAFVGDTTFDVGAAKAAGLPVVACAFGFNDIPVHQLGADAVIEHYDELIPALHLLA
ncbi:HAD family hydrolase [Novosphingobium cyanobacteriorum]|uniref:phosphoglycolate phosphatase n=1 Tax=Novosphingobium cyanobacteriorum TaxID=3024215 RepID=A0ABT6CMM4_9SPHN|nr:HAD-IA family hydrolase [Novosphingobium cyanobacteriorum]MDF8334320.1 HAD-IA family hydrolase [Novosphingobium cyanobacteriorum]